MKIIINSTKYFKADKDINHKDIVKITSEGKWVDGTYNGNPSKSFKVNIQTVDGEVRETTFDFPTVKALVLEFGDMTESWIGKEIRGWKTATVNAKLGYKYVFRPIEWVRDETGAWVGHEETESVGSKSQNDIDFDSL